MGWPLLVHSLFLRTSTVSLHQCTHITLETIQDRIGLQRKERDAWYKKTFQCRTAAGGVTHTGCPNRRSMDNI